MTNRSLRTSLVLGMASVVLALLSGACGGGGDTGGTEATTPRGTEASTPEPTPEVRTIAIEVRDGQVVGGPQRARVAVGEEIEIVVRSDVTDHVHVHGYDLMEDVEAGAEATVRFVADIPGVFEVELEDRSLKLLDLEVR